MSKLNTLQELLVEELKDLYSAETQLVKALPKMAKAAEDASLQDAFETHLKETEVQVQRLEQVAELLEVTPRGKSCKAMKGLIEEAEEIIKTEGEASVKDLALITAAQKVEHYEIAGYGSVRTLADMLGLSEVSELLQTTLDEEGETDKLLMDLAEQIVSNSLETVE